MTGSTWLNLYPAKILGMQDLDTHSMASLRAQQVQLQDDLWGDGGMLVTAATLTVSSDEFTLAASRNGFTPNGYRLNLDHTADEWQDVPFENSGATVYEVGARWNDVPETAEDGTDGQPHFGRYMERICEILTPDSVANDGGGGLKLTMTTALSLGSKWSVSSETRPCIVWYEDTNGDPASTSTSVAIEAAALELDTGVYQIITAGRFGVADLTAARYKVAILGPAIYRNTELPGDWTTDYLQIGTITSGVFSNTGKLVINSVGSLWGLFGQQHNASTGVHTDVTADRVDVGSPSGLSAGSSAGRVTAQDVSTNQAIVENASDSLTTNTVDVRQANGTTKVALRAGNPASNGGGGELAFPNVDQSADNTARVTMDYAGDPVLKFTNLQASTFNGMDLEFDGILRKDSAKSNVNFSLQTNDASAETLRLENIGAGALNVLMPGGDFDMTSGDLTVTSGNIEATSGDIDAGGDVTGATLYAGSGDVTAFFDVNGVDLNFFGFTTTVGSGLIADLTSQNGIEVTGGSTGASQYGAHYSYSSYVTFEIPLSPVAGGWMVEDGDSSVGERPVVVSSTPPYMRPAGLVTLYMHCPLDPYFMPAHNQDGGNTVRLTSIAYRAVEYTGATITMYVRRTERDGTGSRLTVATISAAASSSSTDYNVNSSTPNHTVSGNYYYWLEFRITTSSSVLNARIADVIMTLDKQSVE